MGLQTKTKTTLRQMQILPAWTESNEPVEAKDQTIKTVKQEKTRLYYHQVQ